MDLFQIPVFQMRSAAILARLHYDIAICRNRIKQTARMGDKRLVIDITRRSEDHSIAAITALHMLHNALPRHRSDRIRSAQDGTPQGLVRKSRQLKVIENAVVRRIVRLANFLDDNGTFALELFFVKNRMLQNVGEQIERCLLYTSPSPRDRVRSRMPSSA